MKGITVLCAMLLFVGSALAEDMRLSDENIVFYTNR